MANQEAPAHAGFIRPFILTGGRTVAKKYDLRWETLVETVPAQAWVARTSEQRAVVSLSPQPISIAELSAMMHLPAQVLVVVVGDLLDTGAVRVHQTDPVEIELSALTRMIERVRAL